MPKDLWVCLVLLSLFSFVISVKMLQQLPRFYIHHPRMIIFEYNQRFLILFFSQFLNENDLKRIFITLVLF